MSLGGEFLRQRTEHPIHIPCTRVIPALLFRLLQQARALDASPGTKSHIRTLNPAERDQPVKRRIYPAVDRNIRRAHVFRSATFPRIMLRNVLLERAAPGFPAEIDIVMRPIYFSSEVPAQKASHESVRSEVLLACDSREGHRRGHSVSQSLAQYTRVLM